MYPLAQRDITDLCNGNSPNIESPNSTTQGALAELPQGLQFLHPTIDFTPAEYITLLFTDLGVLTPAAVSEELIKLYQ